MKSVTEYKKEFGFGGVQLRIKNGVDDDAIAEILKGNYKSLWLYSGNFERMFEIVKNDMNIKCLRIQSTEMQDVSWINDIKSFEPFSLRGKVKGKINFNGFNKLKTAELEYCRVIRPLLASNCKLKSLGINKLSEPLTSFSKSFCDSLRVLGITGPLKNLEGISRFKNLESLSLMDMRNLIDVLELKELTWLKELDVTACNKVNLDTVLPSLVSLEKLNYENKKLSSLKIIPKYNMKKIILGDQTLIEDREIEYAFNFPKLESMVFQKKRGYKYSAEELNEKLIQLR